MIELPANFPASFQSQSDVIKLDLVKKYLNIHQSNTSDDKLLLLFISAAILQAQRITDADNSLIDLALLKDIATNYQHRENYLDPENAGVMLSKDTISILNQYRKVIIF
jgi:uncharacterized phage protein (predicted DNA packaging)